MNLFNQLLDDMASPNEQPVIDYINVKFKNLLPIEELKNALFILNSHQNLQIIKFTVFFLLQILLKINIMSIKFSILISHVMLVCCKKLFKSI